MNTSRYTGDPKINLGQQYGTPEAVASIRRGLKYGYIKIQSTVISTGSDRLDVLAGQIYGDSRLWWVLASASSIGWGLQVPPGTVISVPVLTDVMRLI